MRQKHPAKMRDWFDNRTQWNIVSLDEISDLANLVFLESDWTKGEGLIVSDVPNYRLLQRVAKNAISTHYLACASNPKHREYYDKVANGFIRLKAMSVSLSARRRKSRDSAILRQSFISSMASVGARRT